MSADAHDHRALPCPAPCRARARGASPAAPASRGCSGPCQATPLGADAREPTLVDARRRSISRVSHRVLPARLPSYADYILRLQDIENPGASRSMLRLLLVALPLVVALLAAFDEHEVDALQLEVRSPLQFQVRSPPKSRPLRPQPPRELNTIAQPQHTPLRTHTTCQAHTSQWTRRGTRTRARRSTPRSTSSPTSSQPKDTNPPSTGVPPARPAATHAALHQSALPLRARGRCAWCTRTRTRPRARARYLHPRLPDSAPTEARLPQNDATCAGHRHVRARRLACFADGLRVAPLVQAAADARGRARRPPSPRHLRHDRQARRRHHGHEDPAVITPSGSAAWPGGAKPVTVKPVKPVSRARASSRLRPRRCTARPAHHRVRPRRLRPGHRRHDRHSKHHLGLVSA